MVAPATDLLSQLSRMFSPTAASLAFSDLAMGRPLGPLWSTYVQKGFAPATVTVTPSFWSPFGPQPGPATAPPASRSPTAEEVALESFEADVEGKKYHVEIAGGYGEIF